MNELELLEMAAKAAGIELVPCTCSDERFPYKHAKSGKGHWSPLHDDGDALRLAVKLNMALTFSVNGNMHAEGTKDEYAVEQGHNNCAATRRAIVRVAAEIGKAMP